MLALAETDIGMFLATLKMAGPMKHYVTPCITGILRIPLMIGFVVNNPNSPLEYNT
jgi:hypothetical protein